MSISERLIELREKSNQTQQQIAQDIGMKAEAYRRYEYGTREPVPKYLILLADHFDTSTDYILGRTDNPSPPAK